MRDRAMEGGITRQSRRDRRSDPCQPPIRCSTRHASPRSSRLSCYAPSRSADRTRARQAPAVHAPSPLFNGPLTFRPTPTPHTAPPPATAATGTASPSTRRTPDRREHRAAPDPAARAPPSPPAQPSRARGTAASPAGTSRPRRAHPTTPTARRPASRRRPRAPPRARAGGAEAARHRDRRAAPPPASRQQHRRRAATASTVPHLDPPQEAQRHVEALDRHRAQPRHPGHDLVPPPRQADPAPPPAARARRTGAPARPLTSARRSARLGVHARLGQPRRRPRPPSNRRSRCMATVVERSRTSARSPGSRVLRVIRSPVARADREAHRAHRLLLGAAVRAPRSR